MRRAGEGLQEVCFQLWWRVQRGKETGVQGERGEGETSGSRVRVASEGGSRWTEAAVEACWRDLVENPEAWWDNRETRSNPMAPGFKHKRTRRALWVDNWQTPEWARVMFEGEGRD